MITLNKTIEPKVDTNILYHTFEREDDGLWYIVLPDYPGQKGDLLMVAGADKMLDKLSDSHRFVDIKLSEDTFDGVDMRLRKMFNTLGGATYYAKTSKGTRPVWLCAVTKYVFGGYLPRRIYGKVVKVYD